MNVGYGRALSHGLSHLALYLNRWHLKKLAVAYSDSGLACGADSSKEALGRNMIP